MDQPRTTASTCCYCGVGCGVLIDSVGDRIVGVRGDPDHPANAGRLCSKGLSLAQTAQSHAGRALVPSWRPQRDAPLQPVDWDAAYDHVATRLADIVRRHGPDAVAFYVSGQLLTEDYYVFNKLAKGLVGTNNIDTNSRLCMSSAVTAYKLALGADGPPTCYEDLDHAHTVLIAGSNMAYAHPVLYRRLEAAREARPGTRWIVVDPRRTDTAAMADLHLQIQPGTDVALFNGMLHHLIWEGWLNPAHIADHTEGFDAVKRLVRDTTPAAAAAVCGIRERDLCDAAEWFARSPATLSLYCMGLNQSARGTDKNLALINLHLATGQIGRPGAGPFSLTGQPNAMGGREVGGMATMLAAHRDIANEAHRAEVAAFWGVDQVSGRTGLTAVDMFDALAAGQVKAVWIVCTNPAHSLPRLEAVRQALRRAELVIVQEAYADTDTVAFADVLLPAASWGEKEGTVTNSERRISRVRPAVPPPGEARPDWRIAAEIGRRMQALLKPGTPDLFPYEHPGRIFEEHRALTRGRDLDIGGLDYGLLETQGPQQWPYPAGASQGLARRYTDGRYATASGRACFQPVAYRPVAAATSARHPFHLTTGRLRDQWHGMSRTGRIAPAFSHAPEPTLDMHPADAARRGLAEGELVRIQSRDGVLVLPLRLTEDLPSGSVFAAMHWNGQFLNSGGVNEVCNAAVDPRSFQPELKHSAVRIEKTELGWRVRAAIRVDGQAQALARRARLQPLLAPCGYAALGMRGDMQRAVLTLTAALATVDEAWLEAVAQALDMDASPDVLEYRDGRRGVRKAARWQGDRLDAFFLAGDVSQADALAQRLLDGAAWTGSRLRVFTPDSNGGIRDRIVCQCQGVPESAIQAAITRGADVPALKMTLGCGTVCGSCVPELSRLCAGSRLSA
ncbi:MAG: molybdopterin-dependent oxidoreductase [Pigmentiphaga sp.]|uniref:nitrate reductase n=1 Tax=Pigmentiphaga sp. TaxID=1977564 RepID=UPI0029B88C8B|nr:molybdopterin-dependent oxidoreductase [Pigmentiphaga sp.]MDX3907429.1 molybdopterin-dependent oxidoreductase [Pigmentiphaga sp.]